MDLSANPKKVLFFASGNGSNFESLVKAIQDGVVSNASVAGLICNKKGAGVLDRANRLKVSYTVVDEAEFRSSSGFNRDKFNARILEDTRKYQPDLICLAGYLRILPPTFISSFTNRILNIHPSLLPKYPGLHSIERAFEAGEKETGCTVHLVTEQMDAGPILAQTTIPIFPNDKLEDVTNRMHSAEHLTYVHCLKRVCNQGFTVQNNKVEWVS